MGRRARIRAAGKLESRLADAVSRYMDTGGASGCGLSPWEIPTVVACRRVIADTVASTPLYAVKDGAPTRRQPAIYTRPDPLEPRWLSIWRMVDQLTGYGHCWLQPTAWDAADWPLIVRVRDASAGSARFNPAGELEAVWLDGVEHGIGAHPGPRPSDPGEIIWVPYEVPHAGSAGCSPMSRCWRAAEYLAALYEMAGSFWEAGFPSLAVSVLARLSPDDTAKLKQQVLGAWSRRHEPAIMDNGATLNPVGSSAVESQLVESIGMANAEICRTFGVMPSIVNVAGGDSLTYATTEGEFSKWRAIGLGPYMTRLESAWTDCQPHGTAAVFDTSEMTKPSLAEQGQYATLALAGAPWMTVDEVRSRSHLPPAGALAPRPRPGDRPAARLTALPDPERITS
jgi:phage portal protein BeeE